MWTKILQALVVVIIEQVGKPLIKMAADSIERARDIKKRKAAAKKLEEAKDAKSKRDAANNMP